MAGLDPMADILVDLKKRVKDLEAQPMLDWSGSVDSAMQTFTGVVSSTWFFGKPTVILDQGQAQSGPVTAYLPPNSQDIVPGSPVILSRIGGSDSPIWYIETVYGQPKFLPQVPIALNSPTWQNYSDTGSDAGSSYGETQVNYNVVNGSTPIYAEMSSTGIVHVNGLVFASSPTAGSIIAILPPGMRPARAEPFAVESAAAYASVYVTTDGAIRYLSGSGTTLDLAGVRFRAAGFGTFVPLAPNLLHSWTEYTTSIGTGDPGGVGSHTPGYTLDTDGIAIFEGMISGGVSTTDVYVATGFSATAQLTDIFITAAAGSTGNTSMHYGGNTVASQAGLGNTLTIGTAGAWNSLAGIWIAPVPVTAVWQTPTYYNSWVRYNVGYNLGQVLRTPDGVVIYRGMMTGGAMNATSPMLLVSKGWRPRYVINCPAISNSAFGVTGPGISWSTSAANPLSIYSGLYVPVGSAVWFSIANTSYAAFR